MLRIASLAWASARAFALLGLASLLAALAVPARADEIKIDDFEDISAWTTLVTEGAEVSISQDEGASGRALRIDFDLRAGHGFAIVRRAVALRLPHNYVFHFELRGDAKPNDLEFKLVDTAAKNVWRRVFRNDEFPRDWRRVRVRKSRLGFAWGPNPEVGIEDVGAIEIAVTAGQGGRGTIWIDELTLEAREAPALPPFGFQATASSTIQGRETRLALDGRQETSWHSNALTSPQWLVLDLGRQHEIGGLVIDWDTEDYATAYAVDLSQDGTTWDAAHRSTAGNGRRDYLYLPDSEARFVRLLLQSDSRGQGYGVAEIDLRPPAFAASINAFFEAIARETRPGDYPKYLLGKQSYWTVTGAPDDEHEALLNEEGMVEVDTQSFSIEPFLFTDGELLTWNDVSIERGLRDGYLPIPYVEWSRGDLELTITPFAAGAADESVLYVRYVLRNTGAAARSVRLFLALRPFQVSPPWQSLNMQGGVTAVRDVTFDGERVRVNGSETIVSLVPPDGFGAAMFEEGPITDAMRADRVPAQNSASDPFGYASAVLRYAVDLEPGATREIALAVPYHSLKHLPAGIPTSTEALASVAAAQADTEKAWRTVLDRVRIDLPRSADAMVRTVKSTLAYALVHRDGAAIQPGSRAYARSWIRDGAMTSAAFLQTGLPAEVREFLAWFAPLQFPDGKVPCCVDARGADPTPEHDSNGELIYAIAEYYRFTRDIGLVHDLWPHVVSAVDYMEELRARRTTAEYTTPERKKFFGLLPESISHEGYSSHPVHSYWDDFFALRGLKDAADLALVIDDRDAAAYYAELRDDFRRTLYESIALSMQSHGIDYIPGSVELGDFDPTSTAVAVTSCSELGFLPRAPLRQTFDRYYRYARRRAAGRIEWDAYGAYELRNVQAFIRMGRKMRAHRLLDFMLADQRPAAWNQWPEISWRDREAPRFIGDMPHTWIGSAFVSAVRSMFVFERERDHALVVGAGIARGWVLEDPGVSVARLPTHHGVLGYTMRLDRRAWDDDADVRVSVELRGDIAVPPGGIVVRSPFARKIRSVTVNGRETVDHNGREARVREFPANVVLVY